MARARATVTILVASAVAAVAGGLLVARNGVTPDLPVTARLIPGARVASDAAALTEEAIRLYAAGHFAHACERFRTAAERDPDSAARREDAWRCFEGWGWQALAEGRAAEAMALFGQALRDAPDAPELLRGLGVSAVHAGRPVEAIAPLEAVARATGDADVRMVLAHLYDRRDETPRAVHHLEAVIARDARHEGARRLLAKLERERRAESGFERETASGFVMKWPAGTTDDRRRVVRDLLAAARGRLERELAYRPAEPVTVVLYVDADFRAVTGAHTWASGVFDGKIRLPIGAPERDLRQLVLHEYAHAAIHELTRGPAPRWLHEGLAQAIEGVVLDPMLRVPSTLTLAGVEALVTDPDAVRARTGYDLSLWIVHDLLDRGGMGRARELLGRLGGGEALDPALARVYGLGLADLEAQWRRVLGG